MNLKPANKNLFYTNDHEWIDFQGSVAYVGVCSFKLSGIREIHHVIFSENPDLIDQGEAIACIQYDDYRILVHMPVVGKIISFNDVLITGDKSILLQQPEDNGWIALIVPAQYKESTGLQSPEDYKLSLKKLK
jgi:glycine cleavage system H protein